MESLRLQDSISKNAIKQERTKLAKARNVIGKSWDVEVKCYEKGLKQSAQVNAEHLNSGIFPYHKACYLLLDMYMCVEGIFPFEMPLYIEEFARRNDDIFLEQCYLPNSAFSIWSTFVPKVRAPKYEQIVSRLAENLNQESGDDSGRVWISSENHPLASDFSFLDEWTKKLSNLNKQWCLAGDIDGPLAEQETQHGHDNNSYLQNHLNLPSLGSMSKGLRTKVLLKLLKHSTSELQRDHRLARAVLLCMAEYKCFDTNEGVEAFRYFLLTIESEFIHDCDQACHERHNEDDDEDIGAVTHVCTDWREFTHSFSRAIQFGFTHFTSGHAEVISAFIGDVFDSTGWEERESLRELVGWEDEDFTHAEETPLQLVRSILDGLARLSYQFRIRASSLLQEKYSSEELNEMVDEDLNTAAASHMNCTRTLVAIGESVLKRCKANPVTETIGSIIVTGLTLSSMEPSSNMMYLDSDIEGHYLGQGQGTGQSLIDAMRYAELVTHASNLRHRKLAQFKERCNIHSKHEVNNDPIVVTLFLSEPSIGVQTVVKGLFLRQLVETHESGCGYGDFLVWSGTTVTPFESMLYEHNMNFPNKAGYEETPLADEHSEALSVDEITARYDLSVLMLRRAWDLPWTATNHASFQRPFRQAIRTVALCAHRYGMPLELCINVNSYLSRDWWPDERATCWLYEECQLSDLQRALQRKDNSHSYPNLPYAKGSLQKCKGCKVAHACSKKHMKFIHREGHGRVCRTPPMRIPTVEDIDLCCQFVNDVVVSEPLQVEELDKIEHLAILDDNDPSDGREDDNEEWESIASNEQVNAATKTAMVLKYFENKAWKVQKREEHAFENYYQE